MPSHPLIARKALGSHHETLANGFATELETARRIQASLFPRRLPPLPGWEAAARCRPARQVAGDYCDLFLAAPGRLVVALGDVAGKGLGPALVMAGVHALVRCCLRRHLDRLPRFAQGLNRYLLSATPDDLFVSLFVGVLDLATGRLRYVNAGHPPPLLFADCGKPPMGLDQGGPVLGILAETDFGEGQALVPPGSLVVLFSDGLTERRDETGQMLGARGVGEAVRSFDFLPAKELIAALLRTVEQFAPGTEPEDDLSMMVLRHRGSETAISANRLTER